MRSLSSSRTRVHRGFVIVILLFFSCSDPETLETPKPDPKSPHQEPPTGPLPELVCRPNLLHGYTDKTSYDPGDKLVAYLQSNIDTPPCALQIFDMAGNLAFSVPAVINLQKNLNAEAYQNGFGYQPSVEIKIPDDLKSGVYTIENKIPFVVRSKSATDLLVVYPSNTANAYSSSGGKSLYSTNRPSAVSFHRPISVEGFSVVCLKWFSSLQNVSVGFIADSDMDSYQRLSAGRIIVIVGHNEYWTRLARQNFDQCINNGKHALILSGNTMWWQVRYSNDGSNTQLVCYKDYQSDPIESASLKTVLWNDPRLDYPIVPSIGCDFELGGYGLKSDNGWNGYKILRPQSPLLAGTNLAFGDVLRCPTTEYDGAPILEWIEGQPIVDVDAMGAHRAEIIGFDVGFRNITTYGTFIVMQRKHDSGIIVNTASTDWCSESGMGGYDGNKIKTITSNAIIRLLQNESVFSE